MASMTAAILTQKRLRLYFYRSIIVIGLLLPIAVGCKSPTPSKIPASKKDPFAANAPKTPEEEAYYKDVYSGDWNEAPDPFSGQPGIARHSSNTKMPEHWAMLPPGAMTMQEIRAENYQRQMAQMRSTAPMQMAYMPNGQVMQEMPYPVSYQGPMNVPVPAYGTIPPGSVAPGYYPQYPQAEMPVYNEVPVYTAPTQPVGYQQQSYPSQSYQPPVAPAMYPPTETVVPPTNYPTSYPTNPPANYPATPPVPENPAGPLETPRTPFPQIQGYLGGSVSQDNLQMNSSVIIRGQQPYPNRQPLPIAQHPASFSNKMVRFSPLASLEYISDGGDLRDSAYVTPDWVVHYLEAEDTIAHFDTLDGNVVVEPSNRIYIYSPRFGSVRQVFGLVETDQLVRLHNAENQTGALLGEAIDKAQSRSQEIRPGLAKQQSRVTGVESKTQGYFASSRVNVMEQTLEQRADGMKALLESRSLTGDALPFLLDGAIAADQWGARQSVEVTIENNFAEAFVDMQATDVIYQVENGTKTSKLRLIKIASKDAAAPGEIVEFTLRYENVGDQVIGNVTLLDNLAARLAYIEESQKSSLNSNFQSMINEQGSLILRWEIIDPIKPGEFGTITFLCKVR